MRSLALAVVTAMALAYFAVFVGYGMEIEDEGLMLAHAQRTLLGDTPHLDFDTGYTPGAFYLNAALFRVFGESTVPVRVMLALVHAAVIGFVFSLMRPFAGTMLAAAGALGYAAFLPVYPGQFASFNIPYPAWYANVFWLATQTAMDRHLRRPSTAMLVLAGVFAGLCVTFKPNCGAFAVLAAGLSVAFPAAADGDRDRHLARVLLLLAALMVLALPFVDLAIEFDRVFFNFLVLALPFVALVAGRVLFVRCPLARGGRLAREIALIAAGVLVPTLPWLLFFFWRLGPERFVRDVLLIGAGAEGLYGTAYPIAFSFPEGWAAVAVMWIAGVSAAGLTLERRPTWLVPVLVVVAGATAIAAMHFVDLARMPEGFATALQLQLQVACFLAVPPLAVAAVGRALARMRRPSAATPRFTRWIAAVVFATAMLLSLYPRMDSMHLIFALPSMVVIAGAATARLARAWSAVLRLPERAVVTTSAAVVAVLAAIVAAPGLASGLARDRFTLNHARLPVHVETKRSTDLAAFGHVLDVLTERLAPGDRVFGFPALGLVPYALGRPSQTRTEYFFPGRPDHRDETTILTTFEAEPPRFIVTLGYRFGYFFESPIYYFLLRDWVQSHYTLIARAGRYDVLEYVRDGARPVPIVFPPSASPPRDAEATLDWMADSDRELRHLAVASFLDQAGDANGVLTLADAWAPDEARRLLLIRSLGEAADARVLPYLAREFAADRTAREQQEIAAALLLMTLRDTLAPYLFAGDRRSFPPEAWRTFDLPALRTALGTRAGRLGIGLSASYVLAAAGDTAAIPVLEEMQRQEDELALALVGTWLRVATAEALVRLGETDHLCDLVALFGIDRHEVQDIMPSRWIIEARRAPDVAHRCLVSGLAADAPLARKLSAYVAAAVPLPTLRSELTGATRDADPGVRAAAVWALARLAATDRSR